MSYFRLGDMGQAMQVEVPKLMPSPVTDVAQWTLALTELGKQVQAQQAAKPPVSTSTKVLAIGAGALAAWLILRAALK